MAALGEGMPAPNLKLDFDHPGLGMTFKELRFPSTTTLSVLKEKLYRRSGTEPAAMTLSLPSGEVLDGAEKTLEELGLSNDGNCVVIITDSNNTDGVQSLFAAEEAVPKPEGKADAGFSAFRASRPKAAKPAASDDTDSAEAVLLTVGQRVVTLKGKGTAGTVRFVGKVEPLPKGWWAGVELDTPTGKNDGEVKGVRLFTCADNCGAVCRPSTLMPEAEVEAAASADPDEM